MQGSAFRSRRLREFFAGNLAAKIITTRRLWLGLAAAMSAVTLAHGAEPSIPLAIRAEGSFPIQSIETFKSTAQTGTTLNSPYFGLSAIAQLQADLKASVFADGGHNKLGGFRDTDNTFASFGAGIARKLGAFTSGVSFEHTYFYNGTFDSINSVANDLNLFVRYDGRPNPNLQITPVVAAEARLDDTLAVQRYTYSARVDIEQRLIGSWWFITTPRIRYSDYVNKEAGRLDVVLSMQAGLKYVINDSVSIRTLAGAEDRASNIKGKSLDKLTVGASIDFKVDFARPR
jgi:hypothetical protein